MKPKPTGSPRAYYCYRVACREWATVWEPVGQRWEPACNTHKTQPPTHSDIVDSDQGDLFSAASMNATGSATGRVSRDAPATSVRAAKTVSASSQRNMALQAVKDAGSDGLTSIEVAAYLPLTKQGYPQVSNRAASRLGELWELGEIAVLRERGTCVLGQCRPHNKPGAVHRPQQTCLDHGKPITREGAAVWVAV